MKRYAATFVAGCQEIILSRLKQFTIEEFKITYVDDSFIVFDSCFAIDRIIDFRFFNNTFVVFAETDTKTADSYEEIIKHLTSTHRSNGRPASRPVKFVLNKNGEPQNTHDLKESLIRDLKAGATLDKQGLGELWLIVRNNSQAFLVQRLKRPAFKRVKRPAGSLRPELANILGLVAGLKADDTVLDLFSGYGSIAIELVKGFALSKVVAIDKDPDLVNRLKSKNYRGIQVTQADVSNLPLEPGSIDKIVADPPWGHFKKSNDLEPFYLTTLKSIDKVLKRGGVAVILSAGTDVMVTSTNKIHGLSLIKSYPILVSGRKATIYKIRRN